MKAVLINYNHDPQDWWLSYGFNPEDVILYDRSDDGIERTFEAKTYRTRNMGDVDFDKLQYLISAYDSLPEVFLWSKSNIFKFVEPSYLKECLEKAQFAPLLRFDHKTYSDAYGVVNRYHNGMYEERSDGWYFRNPELSSNFNSWEEWCDYLGLPKTRFIPFAPGGSYILTRDRVHRYGIDFYDKLRATLPYAMHPAEAHAAERTYYLLWK